MTRAAVLAVAVLVAGVCFGGAPVYVFDGSLSQYVNLGDNPNLEGMSALTISGWVKYDAPITEPISILAKWKNTTAERSYELVIGTDQKCFFAVSSTGSNYHVRKSVATGTPAIWQHYAAVYNGTEAVAMYLDGVLVGTTLVADSGTVSGPLDSNTAEVRVGSSEFDGGIELFFTGCMRGETLHNRALSAAEISGLYVAGGGRNTFAGSVVLPRANDESVIYTLDAPVLTANQNTGKVLANGSVIASKDAAANFATAQNGVTVGSATISTPAP